MENLSNHPAVLLGGFIKSLRQAKGIVKRLFAGHVMLTPAEYSEVEAGVSHWIKPRSERAIIAALDLEGAELKKFEALLQNAKKGPQLSFSNLFSRECLEPIRCRRVDDSTYEPDEHMKEVILDAVFA